MLSFLLISSAKDSVCAAEIDEATEIADQFVRLDPTISSKWVLGCEDKKLYIDPDFWGNVQLKHIISTDSRDLIKDRVIISTVLYTNSGKITATAIQKLLLIFVKSQEGWRVIPTEFLETYLIKGEEGAKIAMSMKIATGPKFGESFTIQLKKNVQLREESEMNQEDVISQQFEKRGLPLDRVVDPPLMNQ